MKIYVKGEGRVACGGAGRRDGVTFTPSMSDNGISIGNGLISALLGTGLKFDTEKKITLNKICLRLIYRRRNY